VTIGEFGHAIPLLEQAVALAPDSLQAHFYLATAHWLLGEREAAEPGYAKVVELAGPEHLAIEFLMIDTAGNRLAELRGSD
jgi:tetratricopeptide (TPR) repeat protein